MKSGIERLQMKPDGLRNTINLLYDVLEVVIGPASVAVLVYTLYDVIKMILN